MNESVFRREIFTLCQCMLAKLNDLSNLQIRICFIHYQNVTMSGNFLRDFGILRVIGLSRHYCHPLRQLKSQWDTYSICIVYMAR